MTVDESRSTADPSMADDQIGRARVTDTEELEAFYQSLESHEAAALWTVANDIEPWFPQPKGIPMLWSYEGLRPKLLEAARLVTGDDAGRRVIYMANPGLRHIAAAAGLLYTGLQIMNPGESMTAHRHAASALRFVIEGEGAWTIVEGDKLKVGPKDFAITPRGTWHEHGNESSATPVIWQDGLDIPLTNALDANFYAVHPDLYQVPGKVVNTSVHLYGAGTLRPVNAAKWGKRYSPLFAYPWEKSYESLLSLARVSEPSPVDGHILEFVNPVSGGSVMPTMGAQIQRLEPGFAGAAHRHTGNVIYTVAKGTGHSIIQGKQFAWKENDIFVVPAWAWHEHHNDSSTDDVVLFQFNDFPTIKALDFYVEELYDANSGQQYLDF
jgi:gentisate 1,2-dioxygenase